MKEDRIDQEILKLLEKQPEISNRALACALSVSEELLEARLERLQDVREKILVVEDEPETLKILKLALEPENYKVVKVSSGLAAVNAVKAENPDLILLDLTLSEIDGFEVCKCLKADPKYGHVPVIMLSEKDEAEDIVRGMDIGADDYITKPFNSKELKARIKMVLRRSRT